MTDSVNTDELTKRIRAFMASAELSRASMGKVLGISGVTLGRWFAGEAAAEWVHAAVARKLDILEAEQQRDSLFRRLHGLKQREKVDLLIGVLYNNLDWS